MKGAYVVSPDDDLIARVVDGGDGWAGCEVAWATATAVMLREPGSGALWHLYRSVVPYDDEGPVLLRPGVTFPGSDPVTSYLVECRSEDLFARVGRALATVATGGAWVVDGSGVVWDALAVDPQAVQL